MRSLRENLSKRIHVICSTDTKMRQNKVFGMAVFGIIDIKNFGSGLHLLISTTESYPTTTTTR